MSRMPLSQQFEKWVQGSEMTEMEKADCCLQMEKGFSQDADLFLLAASKNAEREILRSMGIGLVRGNNTYQLQNWRIWHCSHPSKQAACLKRFLQSESKNGRKKLVLLLATAGKGSRIRASRAWKRAGIDEIQRIPHLPVLVVQIGRPSDASLPTKRYGKYETDEALLQQAAVDCLQRQVPVLTVWAGRRSGCGKEQLWYQVAKSL